MAFCTSCGAYIAEGMDSCPACGALKDTKKETQHTGQNKNKYSTGSSATGEYAYKYSNGQRQAGRTNYRTSSGSATASSSGTRYTYDTSKYKTREQNSRQTEERSYRASSVFSDEEDDVRRNKAMSVFSYLGLLFLVPLLLCKDSRFARFHSNQGLLRFIAAAIGGVLVSWGGIFLLAGVIIRIFCFACMIMGISNAAHGQMKELPVIGRFRLIK